MDWADLFGKNERKLSDVNQFNAQSLIENVPDANQTIMQSLGKNLIKSIDFFENLLKTPARSNAIKKQAQETLKQMKIIASSDMKLLSTYHERTLGITFFLYNSQVKHDMYHKVIPALEELIKNQAKLLKSLHFPILYKSKKLLERNAAQEFEQSVLNELKTGDYQEGINALLTLHVAIEPRKAKEIYHRLEHAVKKQPKDGAEYFLSILKRRLFAPEHLTPECISYDCVNEQFQGQYEPVMAINIDQEGFRMIHKDTQKLDSLLIESQLKEHYQNRFVPILNEVISLTQNAPQK